MPDDKKGVALAALTARRIVDALGGRAALRARTVEDLRACIQEGLPFRSFEAMRARYGLESGLVTRILDIPPRTLARRKAAARFPASESDRLVRMARMAALAEEVLGDAEKAGRWLQRPNRALGGETPLGHLATELGTRQVEDVLGRIAHGMVG
jgi:putative toxin-antitoxin system antitoxin component (TIGR02293 family)